ncbi:hypothetical protein FRB90_000726 [Tulasnella sp. 427]|nr:hypothetical protein FRB90_000726 [Tulasnella sp. 427]
MSSTPPATASGQPPPQSNAQLAVLLAQAYQDIEALRTERDNALHRAENAQALLSATSAASGPGSSGAASNDAAATITALQTVNESQLRTISDLNTRLKAIAEHWSAYERWCSGIDVRTADARFALGRSINGLTNTSDNDAIASASSPLPFKDILPFQPGSLSRRQSRATLSSHPALQIPPGAPGGRPTSSAGVPSNLPPIPSGVVAGRVRPRESSIPRRRSDDEPGSATFRRDPLDPAAAEERQHRQSIDDTDSAGDAVEGERQRKRIRADAGPAALSTSVAPNIARRDRARFNDSPGANFPQFAFSHNQPQYGQTDMPPPQEYRFPKPPGTEARQRGSEPTIIPPQLHISSHSYHRSEGTRHGPRGNSDSTLASAITPTTAITTPMTGRSSIPSGSKDSFPLDSPHPRHAHRYSRSSGDIRADSMGDPGGIMGGPRTDSPPPIEGARRFPFERQDSAMSVEGGRERDKDRSLGMQRQEQHRRPRQSGDEGGHERMELDEGVDPRLAEGDQGRVGRQSIGRRGRRTGTGMDDDERDSVEEFFTTAVDPTGDHGRGGEGEERDELQDDREMSPMSTQPVRSQSHSGQHVERWRSLDRERELRQREDEQRGDSGTQMHYTNANGLVKIKSDQFRYYSTPDQLKQHSPSTSPHLSSSHPQPQHGSTYPPPAFQTTLAMQQGQLQPIRRGTIAGIVTTPTPRDEFSYQATRASYSGPSHSRRPSGENGPPSSSLSHPSLTGPPSAGGPLSAGTSGTHIIYPHSQQPRHTGPGPAVKPTLNAQGQRTCRQCGQPGRYKDGKCVEKWGPGPAGPGTVCDRCRKKMKRVERRGTQDAGSIGQHLPLQPLAANQGQPQLSPRQYYPPQSQGSYPREGTQYSPSDGTGHPREFQFQTPLSANSPTWVRGSKDWTAESRHGRTGSIGTSPTSQQPKSANQPAAKLKEKRRAPTYSPSPSPAVQVDVDETRSSKSASQARSGDDDGAASNAGSSQPRKNSGDSTRSVMESAAEVLEVALADDDGPEAISPAGSTAKDKDGEDDADGDGDMEDALGEEEEDADVEPSANAGSASGGPDSDQDRSRHSASVIPSPAPQTSRKTPVSRTSTSSQVPVNEKDSGLKPKWVKLEDDSVIAAQG